MMVIFIEWVPHDPHTRVLYCVPVTIEFLLELIRMLCKLLDSLAVAFD